MKTIDPKEISGRLVHEFLAHSYFIYLAAVVVGFGLDELFHVNVPILSNPAMQPVGFAFIILGTALAVWAQTSSERGAAIRNAEQNSLKHDHFRFGPYMFTRTPTQYGLLFMTFGLALLLGSFWMTLLIIVAFLLGKLVFIKKQEHHLAQKYGAAYLEYKKRVRF